MKTKNIRNGSLYLNNDRGRIERVRGKVNSASVLTTVHGEELAVVPSKNLDLASTEQCNSYLGL